MKLLQTPIFQYFKIDLDKVKWQPPKSMEFSPNQRKEKIKKINGIVSEVDEAKRSNADTYLFVDWKRMKETWETDNTVNCRRLIDDLMLKLNKSIEDLKIQKIEKDRIISENNIRQTLLNNKKKSIEIEAKAKTLKETPIKKINTNDTDSIKYNKNFNDVRIENGRENFRESFTGKNLVSRRNLETQKLTEKFKKDIYSGDEKIKRYKELDQKTKTKITNYKTVDSKYIKNSEYTPESRTFPSKETISFKPRNDRYFSPRLQTEIIVQKLKQEDKKSINLKNNQDSFNIFFQNINVAVYSNIIEINDSSKIQEKSLNLTHLLKNSFLYSLVFTERQNPYISRIKPYRFTKKEQVIAYYKTINEMKDKKYCLVDSTPVNYFYTLTIVKNTPLEFIYGNYDLLILKVDKNLLPPLIEFESTISNTFLSRDYIWHNSKSFHDFYTECYFMFQYKNLGLDLNVIYTIFSNKETNIVKELETFMEINGHKKVSLTSNDLNTVFIYSSNKQYIQTIPNIRKLKDKKIKFFIFELENSKLDCINYFCNIYPDGGVITITPSLFPDFFQIKNLNKVLEKLQDKNSKWLCKIPRSVFDEFNHFLTENIEKMFYKQMKELLKFFEACIDDHACSSLDEYLIYLEIKYFRNKRHFFIMDVEKIYENRKTPSEIINYML